MKAIELTWNQIEEAVDKLAFRMPRSVESVFGVPTGGSVVALLLCKKTGCRLLDQVAVAKDSVLVVDDLVDSGATLRCYHGAQFQVDALYRKPHSPNDLAPSAIPMVGWLHFPWEHKGTPTDAVRRLIEFIGDDPNREGLVETPDRVVRSYSELFGGYHTNPEEVLKIFEDDSCDEMVIVRDIEMYSTCEHHMLPFFGKAHIAYIPDGRVVGVSKLVRLFEVFSRRLQIQERLCEQVTKALDEYLKPKGSACVIEAKHLCMTGRGVNKQHSVMVTSSLTGAFREKDNPARHEFLSMIRGI